MGVGVGVGVNLAIAVTDRQKGQARWWKDWAPSRTSACENVVSARPAGHGFLLHKTPRI